MADKYDYAIQMTDAQFSIMQRALEWFFRLQMGQFWDYTDEIALDGWIYNKDDPRNDEQFDAFLHRRDAARVLFEDAFRVAQPKLCNKTPDMITAIDMWSVMRNQRWRERPEPKDHYTRDADPVYLWGGEPPIKITGGAKKNG